jgi:hypothetical protein
MALVGLMAMACAPASKGLTSAPMAAAGVPSADFAPSAHSADSADSVPPRFQFIYVVHGDAGYTYYDKAGKRRSADLEALDQAAQVASLSPAAEVFVFHQKPKRFMGIFPRGDGTLNLYRAGRLIRSLRYDRPSDENPLAGEARLFHALSAGAPGLTGTGGVEARVFAYFGHEIPDAAGRAYSRSRPDTGFSMAEFSRGLGLFGSPSHPGAGTEGPPPEGKTFELVILSACHGGTPGATRALAPYASWVLAAPGELHLSYLDTRALAGMAEAGGPPLEAGEIGAWGRIIASESFERLKESTVTEITLALYDTERASAWLDARAMAQRGAQGPVPAESRESEIPGRAGPRDCADDPHFGGGGEDAGVMVFHQPPRFGRNKGKTFLSGWECPGTYRQGPVTAAP